MQISRPIKSWRIENLSVPWTINKVEPIPFLDIYKDTLGQNNKREDKTTPKAGSRHQLQQKLLWSQVNDGTKSKSSNTGYRRHCIFFLSLASNWAICGVLVHSVADIPPRTLHFHSHPPSNEQISPNRSYRTYIHEAECPSPLCFRNTMPLDLVRNPQQLHS